MRMSCNGCRVLRKGCSEDCSIRPCLQWIKSSDSQANATVFLAKFYGRAGLVNLINAGPDHLRPAIFRSLLYEACGRMVNPIYGSVGLLWSGQWNHCQTAVEAVLKGDPIIPIPTDAAANPPPVKGYDIRHLTKDVDDISGSNSAESHRLKPTRTRFKRVGSKPKPKDDAAVVMLSAVAVAELTWHDSAGSSTSHENDSSVSHPDEVVTEGSMEDEGSGDHGELELGLTLGLGFGLDPAQKGRSSEEWLHGPSPKTEDEASRIGLRLF